LVGNLGQGDSRDVEFLSLSELEKKIKGPFEDGQPNLIEWHRIAPIIA
jgi:hypothetical protein